MSLQVRARPQPGAVDHGAAGSLSFSLFQPLPARGARWHGRWHHSPPLPQSSPLPVAESQGVGRCGRLIVVQQVPVRAGLQGSFPWDPSLQQCSRCTRSAIYRCVGALASLGRHGSRDWAAGLSPASVYTEVSGLPKVNSEQVEKSHLKSRPGMLFIQKPHHHSLPPETKA